MINKIKHPSQEIFLWYEKHIAKILLIVILHIASHYFVNLPYINIFTSLFSFLPFLIDWMAIIVLFKPRAKLILYSGLFLFMVDIIFSLMSVRSIAEQIGNVSYLMLATYVLISLKEIRKK